MGGKENVLIVTSSFPRWEGDSHAHMVLGLAQSLAAKGAGVTVLAPHFPGAKFREQLGEVEVRRFPYFFPFSAQVLCGDEGVVPKVQARPWLGLLLPFLAASELAHLALFLARNRVRSVFALWLIPQGLAACLLKPFFRFRLVSYAIDGDSLPQNSHLLKLLRGAVLKYSDATIAVSPPVAEELRAAYPGQAGKISAVPFGIDTSRFRSGKAGMGKSILFIGRLIEWKGAHHLIECLPEVLAAEPDARLRIVGSGPMEPELRRIAKERGVEGSVEFMGRVPHGNLHRIIQESAVLAHPATEKGGKETLGVALLEAMACGLPVVGAKSGAIPYVLESGKAGILVEPEQPGELAKAIIRVLGDGKLRNELSRRARARAEQFSWGRMGGKFEKALLPAGG